MIIKSIKKYFEENFKNYVKTSINIEPRPTIDVYKNLIRKKNNNINKTALLLESLTPDQIEFIEIILKELEEMMLVDELLSMKIYFQNNPDPRNVEIRALYAKLLLPKFKNHQNRKQLGIHFGTLKNYPEGWTKENMHNAKMELVDKAFNLLTME